MNSCSMAAAPKVVNAGSCDVQEKTPAEVFYMDSFENMLTPGNMPVMTKEYKPQVAFQMDKQLNPQTLKQHVLRSQRMRDIIEHYARIKQCPTKQIEQQARKILDEIGLDRNLAIIRWCGMAISAIGKRISSGIYVNAAGIGRVKQNLGRNPVLYLPSHRSYMDFILMSYVCFHYDIEIPGIAAGMDFHSMFGMGTMLRKTGAFFMRRSFSDDELYWDIFREYMHALVAAYHIGVEFFIEGTRSRNFKALMPKIGLLSMALLPYFTGEVSDVIIVPVSVSYERVLEEQLFVYELLGVPKPKESTKGFFKALKIIDERFGKMYMDFGEPISAREFFKHTCEDRLKRAVIGPHLQKLNRQEIELVKGLANEVVYQQQLRIVISTFNLLSVYYASQVYEKRSVNIDELSTGVLKLKALFEELGANVATCPNRIKAEIMETVEIHKNIVHFEKARLKFTQVAPEQLAQQVNASKLKAHALTPQTMAVAVPALSLQLYINPCLFWLARPSYLILAALDVERCQKCEPTFTLESYDALFDSLRTRVEALDRIFNQEFIIGNTTKPEELEKNIATLFGIGVLSFEISPVQITVHQNFYSSVMLSALAPFLCLYYQLAVTLNSFEVSAAFTAKEVLIKMQARIEQLLESKEMSYVHPYCLTLDNLNIAILSFIQEGYLTKAKESGLLRHSDLTTLKLLEKKLLTYCQWMPFSQYYEVTKDEKQILSKL